jgi:plasmid stabilization system protein ParE
MTIRWTQPANDDFLGIIGWIAANNPVAASSVGQNIGRGGAAAPSQP